MPKVEAGRSIHRRLLGLVEKGAEVGDLEYGTFRLLPEALVE
jgi:hypothetical protein